MQREITKLESKPRRPNIVNVYLDGEVALQVLRTVALTLHVGQFLTLEEVESLKLRNVEEKHYQQALGLLSRRPRSEDELRQRFRRKRVSPEVQDKVIERLHQAKYLDDLAFARAWVENRNAFRPRSAWAIRAELRNKGVASETIDEALIGFDDENAVLKAAAIGARKYTGLGEDIFRKRLGAYLARRGFQYHLINPAVEQEWGKITGREEESEVWT